MALFFLLSLIGCIISFVVCLIVKIRLKCVNNLTISDVKRMSVVNYLSFVILILTTVMGIIFSIIAIFVELPLFVILFVWHIRNIKKLAQTKIEKIEKSVIYCKQCGMAVPVDTVFCPECGYEIVKEGKI